MEMNILVSNKNHRGQKDFSFEVRHKAYARPLAHIIITRYTMKKALILMLLLVFSSQIHAQNTYMILDLRPGNYGSSINQLFVYNDNIYFKGTADGSDFHSLWKFDGETYLEKLLPQCYSLQNFCIYEDLLFFSYNSELWSYDGINPPSEHVHIIQGLGASKFSVYHDTLFFNSVHNYYGNELFFYDGTNDAELFYDIVPGVTYSSPDNYTIYNDALYFGPISGNYNLWCYNGDSIGPVVETNNLTPDHLFVYHDHLFFSGRKNHGVELWKFNSFSHSLIEYDIFPDSVFYVDSTGGYQSYIQNSSSPKDFCEYMDTLYFVARDTSSLESMIWSYHESSGVKMAKHIAKNNTDFDNLIFFDHSLFFTCNDSIHGIELWKFNHSAGAQLVYDIAVGSAGSQPLHLTVFNEKLYFTADDRLNYGRELWVHEPLSSKLNSLQNKENVLLYPNPASNFMYYKLPESILSEMISFNIYDMMGNLVKVDSRVSNRGIIDLTNYKPGVYYLVMTTYSGKLSNTIIVR
jgi:ELWxxDGT repeat protein